MYSINALTSFVLINCCFVGRHFDKCMKRFVHKISSRKQMVAAEQQFKAAINNISNGKGDNLVCMYHCNNLLVKSLYSSVMILYVPHCNNLLV